MDKLKTGILILLVGIAVIGMTACVSAYDYGATCKDVGVQTTSIWVYGGNANDFAQCDITNQYSDLWNWHKVSSKTSDQSGSFRSKVHRTQASAQDNYIKPVCRKSCPWDGTTSSYAFGGWSSNMQQHSCAAYCL